MQLRKIAESIPFSNRSYFVHCVFQIMLRPYSKYFQLICIKTYGTKGSFNTNNRCKISRKRISRNKMNKIVSASILIEMK